MAVLAIDYQQFAQALIANVAAAGGAAGAVAGGGAANNAVTTSHYSGDHMDIERAESSMKKFLRLRHVAPPSQPHSTARAATTTTATRATTVA